MKTEVSVDLKLPGSFRDPSGFVFSRDGVIYRQVNNIYKDNYEQLMKSGLYKKLVVNKMLICHDEIYLSFADNNGYKIIKPEIIDFISYPYEWCFSQLKDAALLTLQIQKTAFEYDMSLKDCSAYNVQFNNRPIFIDTLSFERYNEGKPWTAYKQFCQHFLAPLALASYKDIRLNRLLSVFLDGIPLDLTSSLLPLRTRFNHHLLIHIHLHARAQGKYSNQMIDKSQNKFSKNSLLGLIDSLETVIKKISWVPFGSEWSNYYNEISYSLESFDCKKKIVSEYLKIIEPENLWDLGANTGLFSRIAVMMGIKTISFDIDPGAVERNYRDCFKEDNSKILPLLIDLTNPSPKIGWRNEERMSLHERGPVDAVLALALIHHLAITSNLPFEYIADYLSSICNWLIIEFIPKSDSQVQRLLSTREDIFYKYNQLEFEKVFSEYFLIKNSIKIYASDRIIYLMSKK